MLEPCILKLSGNQSSLHFVRIARRMPAAADFCTVLLSSDGTAMACGDNIYGQRNFPALKESPIY